jgi:NADPH-dependent ferric siderophore reductase
MPEFDHAAAGSAPSASISAARSSTAASRRGADGAAAAAADDTAIPEVRHVASTSKVDATARGSVSLGDDADVADLSAALGNRILDGLPVSRSAAANRRAEVLMPPHPP